MCIRDRYGAGFFEHARWLMSAIRKDRRSLQASIRRAAKKLSDGVPAPAITAHTQTASAPEQAVSQETAVQQAAQQIADLTGAAHTHQSVLAAEVALALSSPVHSSSRVGVLTEQTLSEYQLPWNECLQSEFTSPRSSTSRRRAQPQPEDAGKSTEEIMDRIAQLEEQNKQLISDQRKHAFELAEHAVQPPGEALERDAIVATAIAQVRKEVFEEIDDRVESTVEQDIRTVSKLLVDRIKALAEELEQEREATAQAEEQQGEQAKVFEQRLGEMEKEFQQRLQQLEARERSRAQDKQKDACCVVQ
eukprot:TRINITY_DN24291_c0_g1_i1.p1 TRINITY_DN24291_c0_g1~~TRINITY_DN24291_c0_g1_i1.p1  ORF type:complete len:305 (+),score=83.60 TRINITY_DN24291_c0_g1_i1:132-1046(+)